MGKLFGTDGIRGTANADLSCELALDAGRAIARACREGILADRSRPRVVVGRDTRLSGPMLEAALGAGLASSGADVLRAGILPTPGVAHLVADLDADAGVVLSASHNPVADNGIKVFGPGGWKLSGETEDALEGLFGAPSEAPTGTGVGRVEDVDDASDRYVRHLVQAAPMDLDGLEVVVDCAHGAAWDVAPRVLGELGARVTALCATPDGGRINVGCGATFPELVAAEAASRGVIGLTHDGDADRVLAADEEGRIVDGDGIIAVLADRLRRTGDLTGDAVVVTVMANQALRRWCHATGLGLVEVPVGDRAVLARLRSDGLVLGGEQSGHVIRLDLATTGDGILTGLCLLDAVRASGGRLADLVPFRPLPQVLVNVSTPGRDRLDGAEAVWAAVARANEDLADDGRVLIRPSGTEPLVRVMVEASDEGSARHLAESLADVVRRELDGEG